MYASHRLAQHRMQDDRLALSCLDIHLTLLFLHLLLVAVLLPCLALPACLVVFALLALPDSFTSTQTSGHESTLSSVLGLRIWTPCVWLVMNFVYVWNLDDFSRSTTVEFQMSSPRQRSHRYSSRSEPVISRLSSEPSERWPPASA